MKSVAATQSVAINLNYFNSQIVALGLPSTAAMLFKAFGASLAASVADGPLPFGDIAALLTGTITIAYVAANWDTIGPQWNRIVDIYTTTFYIIKTSVSRALSEFKDEISDKIKNDTQKEAKEIYDKSARRAVNECDSNKQNHIVNNKLHDHG